MPIHANTAKPRLLVVDDQEIIRYSMDSVFTGQGYQVLLASSVAEGMEVLRNQRPDLVLLDLSMPEADGMVLLRQMRLSPLYKQTPVIILTAYSDRNFVIEALQLGTRDYVVKNGLAIDDLVARVRLRLEERGVVLGEARRKGAQLPKVGPSLDLARFLEIIQGKNCGRAFPSVRDQVLGLCRSSVTSRVEVTDVLRRDPVLALHVIRSACAQAAARILDLEEAVQVLGMDSMQNLLEACPVFEPGMDAARMRDVARLWAHCDFCSRLMEQLAPPGVELPALVGLFHDLPVILLASSLSGQEWNQLRTRCLESGKLFPEVVSELFGVPYGEFCNAVFINSALPDYLMPVIQEHAGVFLDAAPITPTFHAWQLETVRQWSGVLLQPTVSSIQLRIPSREEAALAGEFPDHAALDATAEDVWAGVARRGLDFLGDPGSRLPKVDPERPLRFAVRREGWAAADFPLLHLLRVLGEVVTPEMITAGQWDVFTYLGNNPARLWPVGFPFQKPLLILHRLSEDKCDFPGGKGRLALRAPCSVAKVLEVVGKLGGGETVQA